MRVPAVVVSLAVMLVVLLAVGSSACGGDDSNASNDPAGQVVKTPDGDGVITVVGLNLEFDTDEIYAPAGPVTIVLDNQDGGMPHNIHFFEGTNARGESVAETPLNNGPIEDTLEMDLEPGEYFYQCDVHPNMKGILTVE